MHRCYPTTHRGDRIKLQLDRVDKFIGYLIDQEKKEINGLNQAGIMREYSDKIKTSFVEQRKKMKRVLKGSKEILKIKFVLSLTIRGITCHSPISQSHILKVLNAGTSIYYANNTNIILYWFSKDTQPHL